MCRLLSVVLLDLVLLSGIVQAQENTRRTIVPARKAWQWSDDDRIAARTNPVAGQDRVDKYLESHASPQSRGAKVLTEPRKLIGVVDGSQTPELFLPVELFDMVVKLGIVNEDNWRDVWDPGVRAAGLPPDFWKQLERTSTAYAEDLRAAQRAGVQTRELPEIRAGTGLPNDLLTRLCRDRADALAASRAIFGLALDVFMYQTIAPGHVVTIFDDPEVPARLHAMARGCR
ncbi:MAG TPA: hypothetical protein VH087_07155 [Thermoanaerobaculia bacterium]|nr:hypothetical protein [Thermoanaerobaculia bacterium]